MDLGADHIDVELKAVNDFNNLIHGDKPTKCKLIVSPYNYQNTSSIEELGNLVAKIQSTGAVIVKFATTTIDITDVARIFRITSNSQVPIIAMVMGEKGLLCPNFGGYLTFGSLEHVKSEQSVALSGDQMMGRYMVAIQTMLALFLLSRIVYEVQVFKMVQQEHPWLVDYLWLLVLVVLEKHLLMEQKRRVQELR